MKNLIKAIQAVQEEVKGGIEKNQEVGKGINKYKGVADKDVKVLIGRAMTKHKLSILPVSISPKVNIERWIEKDYNNNDKTKQQVLTEVETNYMLVHESGESIEIAGYGHGVDSMDKSAGKATTYGLKYALLYTFLVPTGDIDDSDQTHSEEIKPPANNKKKIIESLYNTLTEILPGEQQARIQQILDNDEVQSYDKVIEHLTALKNKK